MSNLAISRIKREFFELTSGEEVEGCTLKVELYRDNWTELRAEIQGSKDTPYEGGKFKLEIKVPQSYPFRPFEIRFITRIWHPNISMDGFVCRNWFEKDWSPSMTLRTVLLSIQAILSVAEPDHPEEAFIGLQFKNNYEKFVKTAKNWTYAYAGGSDPVPEFQAEIERLKNSNMRDEDEARLLVSFSN